MPISAVPTYRYVYKNRKFRWDAEDLLDTLDNVLDGGVYVWDHTLVVWLKQHGLLEYEGSNRSMSEAIPGPRTESFVKRLRKDLRRAKLEHPER